MKNSIITLVLSIWIIGCNVQKGNRETGATLNALADRYYQRFLETFPFEAYYSDIPLSKHDGIVSNKLEDIKLWEAFEDSLYSELTKIDESKILKKDEKITYWFMKENLESYIALRICKNYYWDVNHLSGWQVYWTEIAEFQPVGTVELRTQAFQRWNKLPSFITTEILNLKQGISLGYTMPKEIVQVVIDQLQTILDYDIEKSPLMSPAIRDGDKQFYSDWKNLIIETVIPAFSEYQIYLKNEYLKSAREENSILSLPNGSECYQAYLRFRTSTKKTGIEIFELGQQIVSANKKKVIEYGIEIYGTNDFTETINRMKADKNNLFHSSNEILEFTNRKLSNAREMCKNWFEVLPSKDVTIKPYEPHESGIGGYEFALGNKPAYCRINLNNPEQQRKGSNEILIYHETYPGHHLQIGIQNDIEGLHPISRLVLIASFCEGWARYSEQLAEEMGLYESKTALIQRNAGPARGMVVDPGVHLKGWTKDQAITFMMEAGWSESVALNVYHRILVWPAQLTSYDVGGEEIKALRRLAEERLKQDFNIIEFHTKILENGSIPLINLRVIIQEWIDKKLVKII
jgi:uncharacterized protein (DUF885 family)